jgi:aspartyl-tRNA(Asn)/glutamyl-tRNA(Gln) amidotransferase subunit A
MDDFPDLSIDQLRERLRTRAVSAREVCTWFLEAVAQHNPSLGILTDTIAASALAEADAVDRQFEADTPVGRLGGIPIIVKDNIDTVPAICAAGLPSLSDYRPGADADVVRRLRSEGAVIIGVAATDSGAFGVVSPTVTNPRYPDRIAGGSSGGSAAAVAAGFCIAAIGTDTGGSIRIPAACCGVAGLKPTFGLVPLGGVRPLSISADHIGPLTRRVGDLRSIMELFVPARSAGTVHADRQKRIGIPHRYFADAAEEIKAAVADAARCCVALGYRVEDVTFPHPDEIIPAHLILSLTEAARFHLDQTDIGLTDYPDTARDSILLGQSYRSHEYISAIDQRRDFVARINAALGEADVLLMPTLPVVAPKTGTTDLLIGGQRLNILRSMIRYTAAFDQSGHPALALPWPVPSGGGMASIQLVGPHGSDQALLAVAEQLETARNHPADQSAQHWNSQGRQSR